MCVMYDNSLPSNIQDLLYNIRNWESLAPYEKRNSLWQIYELVAQHKELLGPLLTEKALYATLVLTNSLDASRIAVLPQTEPLEPRF
jgi:hypothetical protein